jgi:leucyl-tRNA synthetase
VLFRSQWIFIQLFNSWYNPQTDKAESISELLSTFEKQGYQSEELQFTSVEWIGFDEKRKSDILLQFRLAFLSETMVNWCPALGSVLANDEIKDGVSERGGYPVERKLMYQWSLRISAYAERLLQGLNTIDWTESIKESQRNWIGKSEGTSLKFKVANSTLDIEVFTTRPDTIFGVSFVTLAPEHELVNSLTTPENKLAVDAYVTQAKNRSERERQADINKITGVPTGSFVEHPFTGKQIPIWIGDYVLAGYGTGAVMAVPAHDSRDYSFAKHFGLPILEVVAGGDLEKESYDAKEGALINSDFLNGLDVKAAMKKAIAEIEAKNLGKGKVNFRLRDAVFGRQRYWGEPIPIYYKNNIPYALSDSELPLVLPEVDKYLPTEDGEPPLARSKDWKYQNEFDYEHSTMPGWAGSSWYFLRYMDPQNGIAFADKKLADYWKQVDLYIGGSEHATGHLLYVRFWTKILNDLGHIAIDEPAKKLINQGMIQGRSNFVYRMKENQNVFVSKGRAKRDLTEEELNIVGLKNSEFDLIAIHVDVNIVTNDILDQEAFRSWREEYKNAILLCEDNNEFLCSHEVEKMSKSKYNVVTPDDIAEKFGSDTLRLYEMFLGPLEQSKPWNTNGITGVHGFLKKLWRLFYQNDAFTITKEEPTKAELKTLHKTIKKITEDIERFSFNTSVSNFMICVNELTDLKCNKKDILEPLLICLSPYAPHITEELWKQLGHTESIAFAPFPLINETFLIDDSINYPVSVNGKLKFTLELPAILTKEEVEEEVMKNEQTIKLLAGQQPKKVIVVHKKIVNMVV